MDCTSIRLGFSTVAATTQGRRVLYLALGLFSSVSLTGCGDRAGTESGAENAVTARFVVPWVNRIGRAQASSEIRLHALSDGSGQAVTDVQAAGSPVALSDALGNKAWVYRFKDVGERASGVIEIRARLSFVDAKDGDDGRYLDPFELSEQEQSLVAGYVESGCSSVPGDLLAWLAALRDTESASAEDVESASESLREDGMDPALVEAGDAPSLAARGDTGAEARQPQDDARLIVALLRACKTPARLVVGVEGETGAHTGLDIRKRAEVYAEGGWQAVPYASDGTRFVRMRVVPDELMYSNEHPGFYVVEAIGVSVDPGAMRISISK